MKFNKNLITLALCLLMYCPTHCQESTQETNRLTDQQEIILNAVASALAEGVLTGIENAIETMQTQHPISIKQAHAMLQNLMDNLVDGSTFEINDVKYIVRQAQKSLTINNEN